MTLPEFAIRRPVATSMLLISIVVLGGIALHRLPLAFMPEFDENRLFVIVQYPDASPKHVERMIIRPLEETLSSMSGLDHMWSRCDADGGRINLFFHFDVDIDVARAEIRERIDRIRDDLPDDIERITISPDWDPQVSGETILEARLSSPRNLSEDYDLLDRKVIKPLERVAGVASVRLDGLNPKEVRINLDLKALERHRVDPRTVYRALVDNNLDRSIGFLRDDQHRITVRVDNDFQSVQEIRDLPINGTGLRLSTVADVTYQEPPLEYGRHLDGEFAVGVSITKEPKANTVQVCDDVAARVKEMRDDPELRGINFLVWEDQGKEIRSTIMDLKQTGYMGALLASLVLFLFVRRFSTTFFAILSIPISLIVACGVIWAQGKSLNTISLLGLIVGVGMLVDNAVVVMENIDRFQRKGFGARVSALLGAREVAVAVMAATLTSVIVFLPLLFNQPNEMNIILRELALTVIYTLLASLFVSQTLIPLATGWFLKAKKAPKSDRMLEFLQTHYQRILRWTLRHKWVAPAVGLAVIASIAFPFSRIDMNFDASRSEMFVGLRYHFSEQLSLDQKERIATQVEEALEPLRDTYHVKSIYSFWSPRWTLTRLYMQDGTTNEDHMNQVRKAIPDLLPEIAGLRIEVEENIPHWQRHRGKRVAYQLRGKDSEVLARIADDARRKLETIPGLFDVYSTAEGGSTELHASIDRERARQYDVSLRQPGDVVGLSFRGRRLPTYRAEGKEVEMRLILDDRDVHTREQLENLPLLRDQKRPLALESLAEFSLVKSPDSIDRNDRISSVWVGAKYEDGQKETYYAQARTALEQIDLPVGYSWDFNAFEREQQETQKEFVINLGLALLLIFGVMAGLFESARQALSLMVSLPFALTGAVWALYVTDTSFDQPASIGLLLLLGIVVNNGIVMISHINRYRWSGMKREAAMLRGGTERLRPILMTALTTLMGLIPIAIEKPSLAGVYYYSIAIVIMGGLLVSTALTSILLPATVCITEDVFAWARRKLRRKQHQPAIQPAN